LRPAAIAARGLGGHLGGVTVSSQERGYGGSKYPDFRGTGAWRCYGLAALDGPPIVLKMEPAEPFGRPSRSAGVWRRALVYFGLVEDPNASAAAGRRSEPGVADVGFSEAGVTERLEAIERRLADQQRTLDAIHDLLRRDT